MIRVNNKPKFKWKLESVDWENTECGRLNSQDLRQVKHQQVGKEASEGDDQLCQ